MDLNDLEDALEEIRPDETGPDWGLRLMMAMLGNISEGMMRMDHIEDDIETAIERSGHTEEEILEAVGAAKRDMVGALFVAVAEFAEEQDISISQAVEERVERMREARQQRERIEKWQEAGILDKETETVNTELDRDDDWAFQ